MKIDIEEVQSMLLEKKIDPTKVNEIIRDLTKAAEEIKAENAENKEPKQKWEHIVVLNDPDSKLTTMKDDFTAWVVQQREGQDSGLVISKLSDAAQTQNESAKRKKNKLTCLSDIFGNIKSKFLKEKGLRVKTKVPVRVLIVNGKTL